MQAKSRKNFKKNQLFFTPMEQVSDFQLFIKANKLKQKQVAEYLKTSPQYISQVVKGLCSLSDEKYEMLANSNWDVSMIKFPPYIHIPATLTIYNPTAEEGNTMSEGIDISAYPAEVIEEIKAEVVEEMEREVLVPIVPRQVAEQTETNIQKYINDNAGVLKHFDTRSISENVDTAEYIYSTAMLPMYQPNDRVFIKWIPDKTRITDGEIYYFDTRKWPTMIRLVKKLKDGRLILKALNPRYGDITLSFDDIMNIGEVKGMFRDVFTTQYAEIEELRRHKDKQIDSMLNQSRDLIEQNGQALQIIRDLIKK